MMAGRKEEVELTVITKTYDFILWSCNHTGKFPRNHRFVLGERRASSRVLRDGAFNNQPSNVRSAYRNNNSPTNRNNNNGFRPASTLPCRNPQDDTNGECLQSPSPSCVGPSQGGSAK